MKRVRRLTIASVALLLTFAIVQMLASRHGEVVMLTTVDASGAPHETPLWIVDVDGAAWIRAHSDTAAWYQRLAATRAIEVERSGVRTEYNAVPVPERKSEIDALMHRKYGWADAYIGALFSHAHAIPIRLEPRTPDA